MSTPREVPSGPEADPPAQHASIDSAGVTGVVSTLGTTLPPSSGYSTLNGTLHERMAIRFTGSGSEYFRIWIVNLLLILVTGGFYFPWAKVRRLRYFHGNTLVAGQPLGFHGDPKKMLRGFLLVALLGGLYSVAGQFSPVAGLVAFVIVALIWPALFKASLQFRLANTSWRGLRFRFNGSVGGAYRALLPLFVPSAVIVAGVAAVPDQLHPPHWFDALMFSTMGLTALLLPLLIWNLKKYQHGHYAFAQLQTELRAGLGAFYALCLKSLGVFVLAGVIAGVVITALAYGLGHNLVEVAGGRANRTAMMVFGFVIIFGTLLMVQALAMPYFTSRLQNLLWSRTGNSQLRFKSQLRFRSLLRVTLLNWLLMVVTLGLYWPFARVALARLRLESVSVVSRITPDALVAQASQGGDAAGDAAADLFGLDIGL